MPRTAADLTTPELAFLTERHLGTLTTMRPDGSPHVVPIAFTYDPDDELVRITSSDNTQKVMNIDRDPRAVISQVDGIRWLTLEGSALVSRDETRLAAAVAAFETRYRPARENPNRVAIEITVQRILGRG